MPSIPNQNPTPWNTTSATLAMRTIPAILAAFSLLATTGCAMRGANVRYEEKLYSFADAPGVVYLTSFGSRYDLNPPSAFKTWLIGTDPYGADQTVVKPYGIAAGKGRIYINDGLGSSGYWILELASKELRLIQDKILAGSTGIAVDERDYKYFAVPRLWDAQARGTLGSAQEEGRIVVYDDLNEILKWVNFPGRPIGVAVWGDRLYVTDGLNHRVVVMDKDSLKILNAFGKLGEGDNEFSFPKGITTGKDGRVYVGDMFGGRIKVFDPEGRLVSQYGYRSPLLGSFIALSGLAVDSEGRVYAVDSGYMQKISRDEVQIFESANFYPNGEPVPLIETPLAKRRNALYGYFQKPNAIGDPNFSMYRPIDVAIDTNNISYFQKLAPPGVRIEYLIWLTSQSAANGKNVSVFAYTVDK